MPESDGTKIEVSFEIPSLYFDSFLIAFVVSGKLQATFNKVSPSRYHSGFFHCQIK